MGVWPSHPPQHTHTLHPAHGLGVCSLHPSEAARPEALGSGGVSAGRGCKQGPWVPPPARQPTSPQPRLKGCPSFRGACLCRRPLTTKGNRGSTGHSTPPRTITETSRPRKRVPTPAAEPTGSVSVCHPWLFQNGPPILGGPAAPAAASLSHARVAHGSTHEAEGPGKMGRRVGREAEALGLGWDHRPGLW